MDGGAWRAAVHGVAKSRTQLSDFTFTFLFHALEKEMATHSSVLRDVLLIKNTSETCIFFPKYNLFIEVVCDTGLFVFIS